MTAPIKRATLVRNLPRSGGGAIRRLYRLDPPLVTERLNYDTDEYEDVSFEYVITSAVGVTYSGPETYIFGATKSGVVVDWSELSGSFRGELDHERALRGAGYEVRA